MAILMVACHLATRPRIEATDTKLLDSSPAWSTPTMYGVYKVAAERLHNPGALSLMETVKAFTQQDFQIALSVHMQPPESSESLFQ